MELHIHSTVGITRPSTMKLQGTLNGNSLIILIDRGANHNFISADWVTRLGMTVLPTKEFKVKLGDGHQIPCKGICKGVEIVVQGLHIGPVCLRPFWPF